MAGNGSLVRMRRTTANVRNGVVVVVVVVVVVGVVVVGGGVVVNVKAVPPALHSVLYPKEGTTGSPTRHAASKLNESLERRCKCFKGVACNFAHTMLSCAC